MSDKSEIVFIPNGREKIRCTAEGKTFFYTDEVEARMPDDLVERLGRLALMAETANHWTDEHRLMPAPGVADIVYEAKDRIEELEAKLAIAWDTQTVKILIKTAYKEGWADGGDNVPLGSGWEKSRTKATLAELTGGKDE